MGVDLSPDWTLIDTVPQLITYWPCFSRVGMEILRIAAEKLVFLSGKPEAAVY